MAKRHFIPLNVAMVIFVAFLTSCGGGHGGRQGREGEGNNGAEGAQSRQRMLTTRNARNATELSLAEFYEIALAKGDIPGYYAESRSGSNHIAPNQTGRGDGISMDMCEVWRNKWHSDKCFTVQYLIYGSRHRARKIYGKWMPRGEIPQRAEEILADDSFRQFHPERQLFSITFIKGRAFMKVSSKDRDLMTQVCRKLADKARAAAIAE